jgi:hypothetical protein
MQEHMGLQLGRHCTDGRDFADTSRTSVPVSVSDYPSTSDSIINLSINQPTIRTRFLRHICTPLDINRVKMLHTPATRSRYFLPIMT